MGLVLDWQRKLGYSEDPFEPKVSPASKHLVGMTDLQERLNLFLIKDERFGIITGDAGTGKSLLLQWMEEELAPQKSHGQHLFDAQHDLHDNIVASLMLSHLSFFERRFGKITKAPIADQKKELLLRLAKARTVLLIDNASSLGKQEIDLLSDIVLKTPTHLIIADTEAKLKHLHLPETLVDKLKLKTHALDHDQLVELLKKRIESAGGQGTFPFGDKDLTELIKKSDKNPTKLLKLARERAIELSLKGLAVPVTAAKPVQESKGFFSIKVQKVNATEEAPLVDIKDDDDAIDPGAQDVLPEDETKDADMLAQVVTQKTTVKPAAVAKPEAPVDISKIVSKPLTKDKHHQKAHDASFDKLAQEFAQKHVKRVKKRR